MKPRSARLWSVSLVVVQLAAIACLCFTGPVIVKDPAWIWLELAGLALAVWAVWAMRIRQLRITPEVASSAAMVTRGPYRFIRHPMYLAVLLATAALVFNHPTGLRLLVWALLIGVLLLKANHEERLLLERFPGYSDYRRRTKRLIPFLY